MTGGKNSIRDRGAFHDADGTAVRKRSICRESHVTKNGNIHSPVKRAETWLDRAREVVARRVSHDMPEGRGGIDQAESLSDFADAEYRLAMAEVAA